MNSAVFLDRDGTIAIDVPYCRRPEDFELLPTVPQAIRLLNQNGFKVVVITNQSGIARGYFTEEILAQIHDKMRGELARYGAWVDATYYCPHHPDEGCSCRKPGTALFYKAAGEHGIDLQSSYVVGDMQMDIEAGKALGATTVLVTTGPQSPIASPQSRVPSPQSPVPNPESPVPNPQSPIDAPDHVAPDLFDASEWIVGHSQ